jgi:BirA family biotin operon repressor/biotin-[acetyl-CoA-carboxylase] ligase
MERKVITYPSLHSTNSEAARLISIATASQSLYVVSDFQEDGRGQGSNRWVSDAGKNLLMSWIVFPAFLSVHLQFLLSKAVSLAISDLLIDQSIPCEIKWPNDIISNNMKIGGILIENSLMGSTIKHSIIGIGLNINQSDFPAFAYTASSMRVLSGREYVVSELRDLLIQKLENRYDQLKSGDSELIDKQYLNRLFRLNKESLFSKGDQEFSGVIRGVSEMGELMVETNVGITNYGFHEIKIQY